MKRKGKRAVVVSGVYERYFIGKDGTSEDVSALNQQLGFGNSVAAALF